MKPEVQLKLDECARYVHQRMVGLVVSTREPEAASGTLLRAGDRPFVLTAKHVIEDPRDLAALCLFYFGEVLPIPRVERSPLVVADKRGRPQRLAVERFPEATRLHLPCFAARPHIAPGDVDVAIVEVADACSARLMDLDPPRLEDVLPSPGDSSIGEYDGIFTSGLPAELVRADVAALTLDMRSLVRILNPRPPGCSDEKHPARGLHLNWGEPNVDRDGNLVRTINPLGISGAAAWRFRKLPPEQLWHASREARVVGVASAMWPSDDPVCERFESVDDWGDWARGVAAEIAAR